MNLTLLQTEIKTMSSREIATLCEKEHRNVLADIRNMCEQLNFNVLTFQHIYFDSMNRQQMEYLLDKDLTLTLVSGYSAPLRYRIIQRWQALETSTPALPNFNDPIAAARAWADALEGKQAALAQVADLQPKALALDTISHAIGSLGVREAGKAVGLGQNEFVAWCIDTTKPVTSRFMFRSEGGDLHAYQHRISQGMMTEKMQSFIGRDGRDRVAPRVKFTPKGIAHITKLLKSNSDTAISEVA